MESSLASVTCGADERLHDLVFCSEQHPPALEARRCPFDMEPWSLGVFSDDSQWRIQE